MEITIILYGITELFLIICSVIDYRKGEIPAWILYAGIIVIFSIKIVTGVSVTFVLTAIIIYSIIAATSKHTEKWIGGADIDALFVIWLVLGIWRGVQFLFITSALGCIILTPIMIMGRLEKNERVPLIPLITLGFTVTWILEGCIA